MEAAGVDWTTLKTWADFEAACDKIRAAGYDPVIMGAKDSGNAGGLINSFGLGYFAPEDSPYHSYLAQFLDGGHPSPEEISPACLLYTSTSTGAVAWASSTEV